MLRNYLTIALRNLRRHPGYAAINIGGLAVGLAACILIGLYVQDELSYDRFHEKGDRIYQVLREFDIPDLQGTITTTPSLLAPTLEEDIPAVETAVRTLGFGAPLVKTEDHASLERGFLWVDTGFFDMFSFPLIRGEAVLDRPKTVVITQTMAEKYFPNEDPIGQQLQVTDSTLEVTGIAADVPANSSLRFGFVASLVTTNPQDTWGINNWVTYVQLAEGHTKEEVTPLVAEVIQVNEGNRYEGGGDSFVPHLQPLTGIHFGQGVSVEIDSTGNITYVYIFAALAVFMLLLACINFVNLATARGAERAKEVGMRKTLGAQREQLAGQFLVEAILTGIVSLALAVILCWLTLPLLNELAGKSLVFGDIFSGSYVWVLPVLVVAVGCVAGSYPALVLSRFKPVTVLGSFIQTTGGRRLRRGLVVLQFALFVALIAGTLIVSQQRSFMQSAGLGFDQENVVVVHDAWTLRDQQEVFLQELERLANVQGVAPTAGLPGGGFFTNSMWNAPEESDTSRHNMDYTWVGFDFVETLGIELFAGRSHSRTLTTDSVGVVLNETAAREFGWTPLEAIGQKISGEGEWTVIGVVGDFHYRSLHSEIYRLLLLGPQNQTVFRNIAARVTPENLPATLEAMRGVWEQFSDLPFQYSFLADDLAAQYEAEERLATVFAVFAGLTILIACLGLFGLAAYAAETRTKEIGIRKALGASVPGIVALLSKDFLKLVLVAFVIAVPIAYLALRRWLENFAYHIDLGVGVFLLAGVLAVVVALLTVSYQAVRAALADPVKSLRYE